MSAITTDPISLESLLDPENENSIEFGEGLIDGEPPVGEALEQEEAIQAANAILARIRVSTRMKLIYVYRTTGHTLDETGKNSI